MPTYTQLGSEVWWVREYQPPTLAELCRQLREFYGVSAAALGSKGDNNHLYGYHRSAAWVWNSRYCTDRSYSVTETAGNANPGDPNWLCAIDITIPAEQLIPMCQRLDAAVRSGRLEKVVEWYGNVDGDQRVDGYDNIRNRVATSDDSHLWHLHISFDRGRAGEDHSDLYAILTGGEDMADSDLVQGDAWRMHCLATGDQVVPGGPTAGEGMWTVKALQELRDAVAALSVGGVDVAALAAALVADPGFNKAIEDAAFRAVQRAEDE